jgi:hypothetical protein
MTWITPVAQTSKRILLEIEKGDGMAMICVLISAIWHLLASNGAIWSKIRAQDGRCDRCAAFPTQR